MTLPGQAFHRLHAQPGIFICPNPWDAGSACLLAALGFKALATSSAGMAFARGRIDGAVAREAVLAHCRDLVAATALPVSADLEKGFGDAPEAVFDTVVAAAATGLAGGSIEDHTGDPAAPTFDKALAVERIAAARSACDTLSEDFVLTARCDALLWGETNLDRVIDRLQAYQAAGADVLYAPGLGSLDQVRSVCAALDKPVNVAMEGAGAGFRVAALADAGVKRVTVGAAFAQLAYGSLVAAARELAETGTGDILSRSIDYAALEVLFRDAPDP